MSGYRLSERAAADIESILDYTYARFGQQQAQSYYAGLRHTLEVLAASPKIGRLRTELDPPLRSHHHQRHVIFYEPVQAGILIVRVLHERMDLVRHLSGE